MKKISIFFNVPTRIWLENAVLPFKQARCFKIQSDFQVLYCNLIVKEET